MILVILSFYVPYLLRVFYTIRIYSLLWIIHFVRLVHTYLCLLLPSWFFEDFKYSVIYTYSVDSVIYKYDVFNIYSVCTVSYKYSEINPVGVISCKNRSRVLCVLGIDSRPID